MGAGGKDMAQPGCLKMSCSAPVRRGEEAERVARSREWFPNSMLAWMHLAL